MTNEIILAIVRVVVLVLSVLIGKYVIPWLREKLNVAYLGEAVAWAETFVKSAEMMIKGEKMGTEKLDLVTKLLKEKLDDLSIVLSEDQIRSIIEEAVYNIQNQ